LYRFWECRSARRTWDWEVCILQIVQSEHNKLPRPNQRRHCRRNYGSGSIGRGRVFMNAANTRGTSGFTNTATSRDVNSEARNATHTTAPGNSTKSGGGNGTSRVAPSHLPLTMKQSIFGHRIPRRYKNVSRLWLLMRGIIMWNLWLETCDVVFNHTRWHEEKMKSLVWLGLIDYGRMAWHKALNKCKHNPCKRKSTIDKFKSQWCIGGILVVWTSNYPNWRMSGPMHITRRSNRNRNNQ
jgi:hypothetical protein